MLRVLFTSSQTYGQCLWMLFIIKNFWKGYPKAASNAVFETKQQYLWYDLPVNLNLLLRMYLLKVKAALTDASAHTIADELHHLLVWEHSSVQFLPGINSNTLDLREVETDQVTFSKANIHLITRVGYKFLLFYGMISIWLWRMRSVLSSTKLALYLWI